MSTGIVVQDREELIDLLCEAAEFEHTVMCSCLYAQWSLKRGPAGGVTAAELAAIGRWRRSLARRFEQLHDRFETRLGEAVDRVAEVAAPQAAGAGAGRQYRAGARERPLYGHRADRACPGQRTAGDAVPLRPVRAQAFLRRQPRAGGFHRHRRAGHGRLGAAGRARRRAGDRSGSERPCGDSANKPLCDGSHARIGFRSDG
jgi:hypothetical protein